MKSVWRAGEFDRAELPFRPDITAAQQRRPTSERENDLDLFSDTINGSREMSDKPATQTERIFHETKFVVLSCAQVCEASVAHTTVDINIQEAGEHAPKKTKCETMHIVRCETEVYRVKN